MKEEVQEKLEKYNLTEATVEPQNPATTKKFTKQHLMTDTGIELKFPWRSITTKTGLNLSPMRRRYHFCPH